MPETGKFCAKCGTPLPDGASFCPKCGTSVASVAQGQTTTATQAATVRRYEYRHEKQEKREKGEKQEKGEKGEKGRGGDASGAVIGGLILVWLGVSFYLAQTSAIASDRWWAYFVLGLGAIIVISGIIRLARGRYYIGPLIGGAILMLLGFTFVTRTERDFWWLILVAAGVALILSALGARRNVPKP